MKDSKLIDACDKITVSHAAQMALDGRDPTRTKRNKLWLGIHGNLDIIATTKAATLAGCQAKARIYMLIESETLLASILSDLLELA